MNVICIELKIKFAFVSMTTLSASHFSLICRRTHHESLTLPTALQSQSEVSSAARSCDNQKGRML